MASHNERLDVPSVKTCEVCGEHYSQAATTFSKQWLKSTTCSRSCASAKGRANRVWPSIRDRFEAKVNRSFGQGPNGDCHEWQGHRLKWGYGSFRVGSDVKKAHRIAYEIYCAPIPTGMLVRHSCDNPPCCNPEHLSVGTLVGNMADMIERGRKRNRGDGKLPRVDPNDPDSMPLPGVGWALPR